MVNKDRTGPEGKGPMTGRRQGFCVDIKMPEHNRQDIPIDFFEFFNRGFGKQFGIKIQPRELTKDEQVEFLKKQKKSLEEKALRIGEQLKDFVKPLKGMKKPMKMKVKDLKKGNKRGKK